MATFTTKDTILQNASTTTGNGTAIEIGSYRKINIYITGTSASREVIFEISLDGSNWTQISGYNNYDLSIASKTTGTLPEHWSFDVEGFSLFRARLSNVTDGDVTVKGRAVK